MASSVFNLLTQFRLFFSFNKRQNLSEISTFCWKFLHMMEFPKIPRNPTSTYKKGRRMAKSSLLVKERETFQKVCLGCSLQTRSEGSSAGLGFCDTKTLQQNGLLFYNGMAKNPYYLNPYQLAATVFTNGHIHRLLETPQRLPTTQRQVDQKLHRILH